ncbi:hypothetical protein Tco_0919560 [Tanacetum coccineum]
MARQCTQPKRRKDAAWFKEKVLLVQAQVEGKELDQEQLAFLADLEVANDAYDSDCDDISSAKMVLMANLSSCDSNVLFEDKVNIESKIVNESLTVELERYKERVKILKQRFNVDLSSREKSIDSQMDDMIRMKNKKFAAFETEIDRHKQTLSKHVKENESLLTTLNDFGKCFVPQKELSAEQKFWLQSSDKNSEKPSTSHTPVKIEAPSELPKVSLVNKSLKKLRFHLVSFDTVVKVRTTPDAITEGSWGFEHTKKVFLTEIIPWLNKLKDFFKEFDKGLHDEISEVQAVFTQMEAAVEQCSVDRKCCEIQQKQFLIENDRLLDQIISQDIMNIVVNSSIVMCDFVKKNDDAIDICNKCLELEVELAKKNVSKPNATTIALVMYKLDIEPISHRLKNNRDAHEDYLKKTIENIDTIRGLVERAKKQNPSEPLLDSACMFTKHVQELLVYVSKTCSSFTKPSEKLFSVTPLNKEKKVRFADPITSSSNTQSQFNSHKTKDSNQPLLHST